jgi:hypothetical protein
MIKETQHPNAVTTLFDEDTAAFVEIQGYREDTPFFIQGGWFDRKGLAALQEILERVQAK